MTRQHIVLFSFPSALSAEDAYRDHPVHQAFLAWLNTRDCVPLAFDYVLDNQTVLMPE
jgi:hypothetical protein